MVVAIDYEGADNQKDTESRVKAAKNHSNTCKRLNKSALAVPKQIGLKKLRDMFETCYTPNEVKFWIDEIEKQL